MIIIMANQQQQQQQQHQASSSSSSSSTSTSTTTTTNSSNNQQSQNGQQTVIQLSNISLAAAAGIGLTSSNNSNTANNSNVASSSQLTSNSILEMVMCKLVQPVHIINDPRLLDCGHSACYSCIMSIKDSEKNIKCTYCNSIHKLPLDTNKLIVNKSLQSFIKQNLNKNLRLFDEHMFINDEKYTLKSTIDNLEAHLSHIETDIKQKIDIMRYNLDRLNEQFSINIQYIRRELQKIHTDNSEPLLNHYQFQTLFQTPKSQQSQQQQQQTTSQTQAQQTQRATSTSAFLNTNNANTSTLLSSTTQNSFKSPLMSNNDNLTFTTTTNQTQSNASNAQAQSNFANLIQNFSNSSSFEHEDLDELESEINTKPFNTNSNNHQQHQTTKRHLNKEQAQFNKFVREEVTKRFGENFLLQHEVNQLESSIMDLIKNEAISSFLPKDTAPARAWTLAKVSLRSLKRDLRRKQSQMFKPQKQDCKNNISLSHPYLNV